MTVDTSSSARQRILATAYELFTRRGIRDVGVDEVVQKAAVAKTTLYRHFPSKDDLVVAFLAEREQAWTVEIVEKQSQLRADDPAGRLLAIFDVFDDWFAEHTDFESCSFVKVLLEMGADAGSARRALRIWRRSAESSPSGPGSPACVTSRSSRSRSTCS